MPVLTQKESQLLAALNQVLYEIRNTVSLNDRPKSLRRSIAEADFISREISGQPPIQRTKV